MKKILIAIAAIAVIGTGGYWALNKSANNVAEQQLTTFLNENQNKPITITRLEIDPTVDKANITIKEVKDSHISSVFLLKLVGQNKVLEIPLNSEIIRGKTEYDGKSYGFGKIVTHPDLSQFKELPKAINNDTLTSTQYIALDGGITSVDTINSIEIKDKGSIKFGGLTAVSQFSLLNSSVFETKISSQKLTISEENKKRNAQTLEISPIELSIKLDEEGNSTGDSKPFSVQLLDSNTQEILTRGQFSKGTYSGTYKHIDGLTPPISNGKASFEHIVITDSTVGENQLHNIELLGGIYEAKNNLVDVKANLSADVDTEKFKASGLSRLPRGVQVTPKSLSYEYKLSDLSYDLVNTYYDIISRIQFDDEPEIPQEMQKQLMTSLQKTDGNLSMALGIKTEEGNADGNIYVTLSEKGKTTPAEAIVAKINSNYQSEKNLEFVTAKAHVVIDNELADKTGLSTMLQMMLGIQSKDSKYTIDVEVKDGHVNIGDRPIM